MSNFARDLTGVADNMQRALGTLTAEQREQADPAIKSFIEGVELTERELAKVMEKHGIRKFDPKGQKFDPNLHQAMFEVPDPSVLSGASPCRLIAARLYDRRARAAAPPLVGVAKGGLKAAPAANENADVGAVRPVDTQA